MKGSHPHIRSRSQRWRAARFRITHFVNSGLEWKTFRRAIRRPAMPRSRFGKQQTTNREGCFRQRFWVRGSRIYCIMWTYRTRERDGGCCRPCGEFTGQGVFARGVQISLTGVQRWRPSRRETIHGYIVDSSCIFRYTDRVTVSLCSVDRHNGLPSISTGGDSHAVMHLILHAILDEYHARNRPSH